jgi:hypothetical protein
MTRYTEEAEKIRSEARKIALTILVWGPGKPGPKASRKDRKAYKKRSDIRKALNANFPNAEVHFSEDAEMEALTLDTEDKLLKEAVQAKISDLIVTLAISRGANVELDYFIPKYPWIRDKLHVFLPEQYVLERTGLVWEVLHYLKPAQIQGYTDEEYKVCTLATEKAVAAATAFALRKMLLSNS